MIDYLITEKPTRVEVLKNYQPYIIVKDRVLYLRPEELRAAV